MQQKINIKEIAKVAKTASIQLAVVKTDVKGVAVEVEVGVGLGVGVVVRVGIGVGVGVGAKQLKVSKLQATSQLKVPPL